MLLNIANNDLGLLSTIPKPGLNDEKYNQFKYNSTPIKKQQYSQISNHSFNCSEDELHESKDIFSRIINLTDEEVENNENENEKEKISRSLPASNKIETQLNDPFTSISENTDRNSCSTKDNSEYGLQKIKDELEELIEWNKAGVSEIEEILHHINLNDTVNGFDNLCRNSLNSKFENHISSSTVENDFHMNFLTSDSNNNLNALVTSTQKLLSLQVELPNGSCSKVNCINPKVQQNAQNLKHTLNMLVRSL